jgi:cobalt-zinc-cadmium efflux system protein
VAHVHIHRHAHGHAHDHGHAMRGADRRVLTIALGLTAGYMVVEVVGGLITGSLALLADAGHVLSDVISLAVALVASWLAGRPAAGQRTFGLQRAEVLAALANGVALAAVGVWIVVEAVGRLRHPPHVAGAGVLAIAAVGLAINAASAGALSRGRAGSLNISAAMRHVLADALGSAGVMVAALVILITGWQAADPVASLAIAALVLLGAGGILRDAGRVLLEAAPSDVDVEAVGRAMAAAPGVIEIHDLHVWTITSGFPALAAHVIGGADEDCHGRRAELERLLHDEFAIEHTTLQVEHAAGDRLLAIEDAPPPR